MSEEKFDAIVVGGGLAGLSAASVMAREGLEVLLVEKGNYCGSKNVTGGRFYGHSLEKIIPGFSENAPVERKITKERFSTMKDGKTVTVEYDSKTLHEPKGESYSVLRGKFDQWFAEQAEEMGVMMVCGVRVDDLLIEDGKVAGVIAGDEEMQADVVVLADGVNSLLGQKIGLKEELKPDQTTVGAKEVITLSPEVIQERFGLSDGEGVAWIFHNCCTEDGVCDGFLYTNKDSVSIGITMYVGDIDQSEISVPQMLEDFKSHPEVAPLIEGGKLAEYSAHLIPEGGYEMIPELCGDGVIIAGDAAALTANFGFTIRGMDLAVESGRLAAETVLAVKEKGDFSKEALSAYKGALEDSFVVPCMKAEKVCREVAFAHDYPESPVDAYNKVMEQGNVAGN